MKKMIYIVLALILIIGGITFYLIQTRRQHEPTTPDVEASDPIIEKICSFIPNTVAPVADAPRNTFTITRHATAQGAIGGYVAVMGEISNQTSYLFDLQGNYLHSTSPYLPTENEVFTTEVSKLEKEYPIKKVIQCKYDLGNKQAITPVEYNGVRYEVVGTTVRATTIATGAVLWEKEVVANSSELYISNNQLVVVNEQNYKYTLNPVDGTVLAVGFARTVEPTR